MSLEYRKMVNKNKKQIMKHAKEASKSPWDWSFGLDMFIDYLKFMKDYYELGEHVWGCEEEGMPTRLQLINWILAEYNDWQNCEDTYTKVLFRNEPDVENKIKSLQGQGYHLQKDVLDDKMFSDVYFLHLYEDHNENSKAFIKEYTHHRKRFFELLGEYIEYLWD